MHKLYLISFLLLLVNFGFAQTDNLQLLKGEWYYFGPTQPDFNDSFRLSREKTYDIYVKWEFRENGTFYEQNISESQQIGDSIESVMVISGIVPSVWAFNEEKQTVELSDLSRMYRITEINENFLELLRLK